MPRVEAVSYALRRFRFAGSGPMERQMANSMASDVTEADTSGLYELSCNDCAFQATVDGDLNEALEVANSHQEGRGETQGDHFVDFELQDRSSQ